MHPEFYEYLQKLHLFIESQEKRIRRLETLLENMQSELKEIKAKPTIMVDKIEYKFDQLKVETLDGTLNIGLNPSDMQGIEDFAVGKQTLPPSSPTPADKMRNSMAMEDEILTFVEGETEGIISKYAVDFNKIVDSSYHTFIKDDIKKQLSARIESYMSKMPAEMLLPENEPASRKKIIDQLKMDIDKGIETFIRNLPD